MMCRIKDLKHQIDRDHAWREENPHTVGLPARHRIPKLKFKINYARDGEQSQEGITPMAKSVEGKNKAAEATKAKATKKDTWGSKEMAAALKVDPKRLRTILRAAGKGVSGDGEVGRYEWKPNDQEAIKKLGKMVAAYEAKVAERAAAKDEDKPAAKKTAKKAAPAAKKAKKTKPAPEPEEAFDDEGAEAGAVDDIEVFEEDEEEVEA